MSTTTWAVTGMTCGHCAGAVTSELNALPGVSEVAVEVVSGGTSTVSITADQQPDQEAVAAAISEAGDYVLVGQA
jgi:copper chaperone